MIVGSQSTPLREIKNLDEINSDTKLREPTVNSVPFSDTISGEKITEKTSLSNTESNCIIEYRALLPQYKEFSSDDEFNKTRESVTFHTQKKNKNLSIKGKKHQKIDEKEDIVVIEKSKEKSKVENKVMKMFSARRKILRSQKTGQLRNSMYSNWSSKQSVTKSPFNIKISDTRRLLNSTKVSLDIIFCFREKVFQNMERIQGFLVCYHRL